MSFRPPELVLQRYFSTETFVLRVDGCHNATISIIVHVNGYCKLDQGPITKTFLEKKSVPGSTQFLKKKKNFKKANS